MQRPPFVFVPAFFVPLLAMTQITKLEQRRPGAMVAAGRDIELFRSKNWIER
jgi:hypothetical protein